MNELLVDIVKNISSKSDNFSLFGNIRSKRGQGSVKIVANVD